MKTALRILRDGAQMMREHCAPIEIWRDLDRRADLLENGINPLPVAEKSHEVVVEDESE